MLLCVCVSGVCAVVVKGEQGRESVKAKRGRRKSN